MSKPKVSFQNMEFELFMDSEQINAIVTKLGSELNHYYQEKSPILVSVLNGAFIFTADLLRNLEIDHQLEFVKISSYTGTESTGLVNFKLDLEVDITGQDVLIIEDIVDTGLTISKFIKQLKAKKPRSVEVCSLLSKPSKHHVPINIRFLGTEIPDHFVIGYGLDIDGKGRSLSAIYQLNS